MARRKIKIDLRLSEEEAALLNSDVEKSGYSREAYLRALIKQRPIKERPPMDLVDVLKSLQQINNNMNQVATKANSLKRPQNNITTKKLIPSWLTVISPENAPAVTQKVHMVTSAKNAEALCLLPN